MKIGLYGGSFDPIHYGHIRPVRQAREALALDRVIYLPTANPPHKSLASLREDGSHHGRTPALARYAMAELALLAEKDCFVSTFELGTEVAFTVDSLEHFRRRWPKARLFLILGSDSLVQLDTWRNWRRILELAELAVLERPDVSDTLPPRLAAALDNDRVHRIANLPVAASSTEIRRRLSTDTEVGNAPRGHDIAGAPPGRLDDLHRLVPPLVLDYIVKYELYR